MATQFKTDEELMNEQNQGSANAMPQAQDVINPNAGTEINNENQNQPQGPVTLGGTGIQSADTGGQGALSGTNAERQPRGSVGDTQFVGIQKFLDANKGQGEGLAERLINPVQEKATGIQAQDATIRQQAQSTAQAAAAPISQALLTKVQNSPQLLTNEEKQQYQRALNAGQINLSSVQPSIDQFQQQVNQFKEQADALGTRQGRTEMLQGMQNLRRPSQGVTALNQAIVQSDTGARDRLQQFSEQVKPEIGAKSERLVSDLDSMVNTLNSLNQQARTQATQTGTGARDALLNQAQENITKYNPDQVREFALRDLEQAIRSNNITPEIAQRFGISAMDLMKFNGPSPVRWREQYGSAVDPRQFANVEVDSTMPLNRALGAEDFAALQALEDLLGLPQEQRRAVAGSTTPVTGASFDMAGFLRAIERAAGF